MKYPLIFLKQITIILFIIFNANFSIAKDRANSNNYNALNPNLLAPVGVRPCCVFGVDLKTQLANIPVPLISISNVIDLDEIGKHQYNDGSSSVVKKLLGFDTEQNGLIFTKKAGIIDLAHVRDSADYTYYLFNLNYQYLGTYHILELPSELRYRKVR